MAILLATSYISLQAQQRVVSGTVTSADDNAPLPGVNVVVKGTTNGTVTDINGNYSMNASDEASTLVFSFIGFISQDVEIGSRTSINVILQTDVSQLNEVVVTGLGISREKKALGYSVEQISGKDIQASGQTNIVSALQGRISGVNIQNSSGAPGAGADITIRGITSLDPNSNNRPLYIIDGIEMDDDVDVLPILPSEGASGSATSRTQSSASNRAIDINVEDIASLSVLKGAQATALYGVRASNGAIIITTKKGEAGVPKAEVHFNSGWENVGKVPKIQRSYIDGHRNTSLKRSFIWDTWGAKVFDGEIDPTRDINHEIFRTGYSSGFGGSVMGGSETVSYRISVDRFKHSGIVNNTDWAKTNFGLTSAIKLSKKLSATATFKYTNSGGNKPHEGQKSVFSDLSYMSTVVDPNHYDEPYVFGDNFAVGIIDHPKFLTDHNTNVDDVNRLISGIQLKYDINEQLSLHYNVGGDSYSESRKRIVHPETDEGSKVNGFVIEANSNKLSITSNLYAKFNKDINEDFNFSAILGQYIYAKNSKWVSTRGEDLALDNLFNLFNSTNLFQSNSETKYRNAAVYGEIDLAYKDYLFLTVTGRNDWSSTLPKNNNSYFFPSVGLSWVISDMIDMPNFVTFAKLRSSFAKVGKDTRPYVVGRYFGVASNFPFGDAVGFDLASSFGDIKLKPEFTNSFEIGLDLRFVNNRFGLDFSYYQDNITDMIFGVNISNTTGASKFTTNVGELKNTGVEVLLRGEPIKTDNFSWHTSINWSKNEGKVIDIADDIDEIPLFTTRGIVNKYVRGGKIGDMYGHAFKRAPDGQLIIGSDGFPSFDWNDDVTLEGNALPDWIANWNNTLSYKDISLSFLWEWRKGGNVVDMGRRNSMRNGKRLETERRHEEVVFTGVTEVTDVDGNVTGYEPNTQAVEITGPNYYRSSTRYNSATDVLLEDASWVRLRNINLSYTLPKSVLENIFVASVRLTFSANNVFLNTPFLGFDPEVNYFGSGSNIQGFTGLKTPSTKSYSFKLNIGF